MTPPKPAHLARTIEGRQLSVVTSQSRVFAPAGATMSLFVDVTPKPKMHVYAPEQTGAYIRIELDLDEAPSFKASRPRFPKASDYYFAPLKETFKVFDAPFRIRQDITLKGKGKSIEVTGTLRYQACDDEVCYRPQELKVAWTIAPRAGSNK